jgi:hypothetical protein
MCPLSTLFYYQLFIVNLWTLNAKVAVSAVCLDDLIVGVALRSHLLSSEEPPVK